MRRWTTRSPAEHVARQSTVRESIRSALLADPVMLTAMDFHLHSQARSSSRTEIRIVVSPRRARSIRALAERENVDLVLVSGHGKSGDASERYGGIAARLIQESGRPAAGLSSSSRCARRTASRSAASSRCHTPDT